MIISKNSQNCIEIKFEIENVNFVRQKWVENFESKILSDFKLNKLVWDYVNFSINKLKIVWFKKIKFLTTLKLNFNGGQFYKKILNFGDNKNL